VENGGERAENLVSRSAAVSGHCRTRGRSVRNRLNWLLRPNRLAFQLVYNVTYVIRTVQSSIKFYVAIVRKFAKYVLTQILGNISSQIE